MSGCLEIGFKNVDAFKALVSYMYDFTKENVLMVVNGKEIKLIYEEANRGRIFVTLKMYNKNIRHNTISSTKVINSRLSNYFILELSLECLKQAIDSMFDKQKITLELKEKDDFDVLFFTGNSIDVHNKSVTQFQVNARNNCNRINPPPCQNPLKFNPNDLDKLLKMAELFSNVRDNLLVSVHHNADYHILKIRYSLPTGSKVHHQIKQKRKDQVNIQSSDVSGIAVVKSRLFATFFKLGELNNVSCCIKHDNSIILEAVNSHDENIEIKAHLKGLSEEITN